MNTVYGNIISPYARKVYLTLELKGAPFEARDVLPHDTEPAFRTTSWLGKIPGFEDEEVRISDSSVICDYLDHKYPTPSIYPDDAAERAQALWLEEYADTHLQDLLLRGVVMERVIKPTVRKEPTDEARLARIQSRDLPPELDYLEARVDGPFLVGGQLSIADLAVVTAFVNARYASYEVDASRWPALAGYLMRQLASPLFEQRLALETAYLESVTQR
ncbi:MAG: glutathione S-transferase family protein [Deltaproteobacteria bacterium]|nr:glutathione S-transferase family protein [Deltaproteobacteria bacterium]MBW2361017.1 glutathione S-transferase family protein [Deltaproteobacteria bacterium]